MAFKSKQVIALIPARGGSKGVKRKNVRNLAGKPLLTYTVEAALGAETVDRIFVSSDDTEILTLASQMGADVIERATEAATDRASASDVVADFLRNYSKIEIDTNFYLIYLQPTSPLRRSAHIESAFAEMASKDCDSCMSVNVLKKTPFKSFLITPTGRLQSLFDEITTSANRQDLPTVYYPNGAIYIFPISKFIENEGFPSNGSLPFVMSERDSLDIDTEEDFTLAEKLCAQS